VRPGGDYLVEEREAIKEGEQARGCGWEVGGRALADGPPELGRNRRFEPLHGEPVAEEKRGWVTSALNPKGVRARPISAQFVEP
jgi:hypothetical protein